MRLYVNGKSKRNIGYIPDWLTISYLENNQNFSLCLDIEGSFTYSKDELSCCVKGKLIPWTLHNNDTGEEICFDNISEEEIDKAFPEEKIAEIISKGYEHLLGIYPCPQASDIQLNEIEDDRLFDTHGLFELYTPKHTFFSEFSFCSELNI